MGEDMGQIGEEQ